MKQLLLIILILTPISIFCQPPGASTTNPRTSLRTDNSPGKILLSELHDGYVRYNHYPAEAVDKQSLSFDTLTHTLLLERGGAVNLSSLSDETNISYDSLTYTLTINDQSISLYSLSNNTDNQQLGLDGNFLTLDNSQSIDLTPFRYDTDNQFLFVESSTDSTVILAISNGNSIEIPVGRTSTLTNNSTDDNISISNGIGDKINIELLDNDPYNEIQAAEEVLTFPFSERLTGITNMQEVANVLDTMRVGQWERSEENIITTNNITRAEGYEGVLIGEKQEKVTICALPNGGHVFTPSTAYGYVDIILPISDVNANIQLEVLLDEIGANNQVSLLISAYFHNNKITGFSAISNVTGINRIESISAIIDSVGRYHFLIEKEESYRRWYFSDVLISSVKISTSPFNYEWCSGWEIDITEEELTGNIVERKILIEDTYPKSSTSGIEANNFNNNLTTTTTTVQQLAEKIDEFNWLGGVNFGGYNINTNNIGADNTLTLTDKFYHLLESYGNNAPLKKISIKGKGEDRLDIGGIFIIENRNTTLNDLVIQSDESVGGFRVEKDYILSHEDYIMCYIDNEKRVIILSGTGKYIETHRDIQVIGDTHNVEINNDDDIIRIGGGYGDLYLNISHSEVDDRKEVTIVNVTYNVIRTPISAFGQPVRNHSILGGEAVTLMWMKDLQQWIVK